MIDINSWYLGCVDFVVVVVTKTGVNKISEGWRRRDFAFGLVLLWEASEANGGP